MLLANNRLVGTNQSKGGAIRLEGARAITIENKLSFVKVNCIQCRIYYFAIFICNIKVGGINT